MVWSKLASENRKRKYVPTFAEKLYAQEDDNSLMIVNDLTNDHDENNKKTNEEEAKEEAKQAKLVWSKLASENRKRKYVPTFAEKLYAQEDDNSLMIVNDLTNDHDENNKNNN